MDHQAIIYRKTTNRPLSNFQCKVNEAAIELALAQPNLVRKRGELLTKARRKVSDDGYCFKKGKSRSKLYGTSPESVVPKRIKLDQKMRDERIKGIEEDIADISSHIAFNEKRCSQTEIAQNYKTCDEVTQEILECKSRKQELEKQLRLLMQKEKRSRKHRDRV